MTSSTTLSFRQAFAELSPEIQAQTRKAYRLWKDNPNHPSLHFKKIGKIWSARVDGNDRVLAHITGGIIYWFWVGSHAEYERLLNQHRDG